MSADAPQPPAVTPLPESSSDPDRHRQVRLKSEGGRLLLTLPAEAASETTPAPLPTTWTELWQQLKQRLTGGDRFWQPNTTVHLIARDRLLDSRQLQATADALAEAQRSPGEDADRPQRILADEENDETGDQERRDDVEEREQPVIGPGWQARGRATDRRHRGNRLRAGNHAQ